MCEAYCRALLKVSVAQVCQSLGFNAVQESASHTLVDILENYILQLGHHSRQAAELACRTESNFNDVCAALEDLGVSLEDLNAHTVQGDMAHIGFPRAVPHFPLPKRPRLKEPADSGLEEPPPYPSHIPDWMPPLPPSATYQFTPCVQERTSDVTQIRRKKNKQKRQTEASLVRLGSGPSQASDPGPAKGGPSSNPFAAPPRSSALPLNPFPGPSNINKAVTASTAAGPLSLPMDEEVHLVEAPTRSTDPKDTAKWEQILNLEHSNGLDSVDQGDAAAANDDAATANEAEDGADVAMVNEDDNEDAFEEVL